MVSLAETYSPSRRFKRRVRRRTDTIGLRLGFLSVVLGIVGLVAKAGYWRESTDFSPDVDGVVTSYGSLSKATFASRNRNLAGSGDFCDTEKGLEFCQGNCFEPEGIGACCAGFAENFTDDTLCLAEHDLKQCKFKDLCTAELIPGTGGGAECLQQYEKDYGIVMYLAILLYLFLGLAIVVDDYFTVALESIAAGLGVSEDVNGATFAAIGSSAPELFVSLADNVIAQPPKSVGIGTIVGSAIFNILVIIGASAIVAGKEFGSLELSWKPLLRDSVFYAISIALLVFVVSDGKVTYYEGLYLMGGYFLYLTFMVFNQRIFSLCGGDKDGEDEDELTKLEHLSDMESTRINNMPVAAVGSVRGLGEVEGDNKPYFDNLYWPQYLENAEETSCFVKYCCGGVWPWLQRAYFVLVFPLNLLFRFTVPDANYDIFNEDKVGQVDKNRKKTYWLEFVMCIVHIAVFSHFLVFAAAKFGCLVGIPPSVMGLTILAAGTSIPDAITSILLTRDGQGDGAVANSIGSNVFDILIGLGLPWMLAGVIYETDAPVAVDDLSLAIIFLYGVLGVLIITLILSRFRLNAFVGVLFIALYAGYVCFELFGRDSVDIPSLF